MNHILLPPSQTILLGTTGSRVYAAIPMVAMAVFFYMIYARLKPMRKAAPDNRWGDTGARLNQLLKIDFVKPTPVKKLYLRSKVAEVSGRKIVVKTTVSVDGDIHARSEAVMVQIPEDDGKGKES
jgi:acyl-coenzyme A thioesterase PaaI-like protein